jgi:hypothetical protein
MLMFRNAKRASCASFDTLAFKPRRSRQMMSWKYHEKRRLDEIVEFINRLGKEGWYGYIANWSPGFDSGSPYKDVPHPTHLLPYVLNYFIYREMTWQPELTLEQMRQTAASAGVALTVNSDYVAGFTRSA